MQWEPRETDKDPPADQQHVLYYFAPFASWYIGQWDAEGESFYSRSGFCDKYDAPYWHPAPPPPSNANSAAVSPHNSAPTTATD
jgi:hypothetical protein